MEWVEALESALWARADYLNAREEGGGGLTVEADDYPDDSVEVTWYGPLMCWARISAGRPRLTGPTFKVRGYGCRARNDWGDLGWECLGEPLRYEDRYGTADSVEGAAVEAMDMLGRCRAGEGS